MLTLAKLDMAGDIDDKIRKFQPEKISYFEDDQAGILAAKIQALQQSLNFADLIDPTHCADAALKRL